MDNFQIVLVQSVISMMEHEEDQINFFSVSNYLKQRIGYFEERCTGKNGQENPSLSLSEVAELHTFSTHYCYALEAEDNTEQRHRYHVASAHQVRDKLASLRDQMELDQ